MREGKGTYYFDKENNFHGHWKNNIPHGSGILTQNGEKKLEGEFRYGKFIREEKIEDKKSKKSNEKHKHRKHSHDNKSHKSKNKIKHLESDNNTNTIGNNNNSDDNNTRNSKEREKKLEDIDGIPGVCTKKKI